MKGIWNNSEVRDLFLEVENCKSKNRSLREAFILHAQKYNRQPNSVRNYYYMEVDELGKDSSRLASLGIDLKRHKKNSITYFSKDEEESLMQEISRLVANGVSVRKACLSLSNGDVSQMLRFQNKYRNYLSKQSSSKKELVSVQPENNVIAFKKVQKTLSDSEVQSLFMGLVRLVKRNATIEKEEVYKKQLSSANDLLRKTLTQLSDQQRQYEKLKADYLKIKNENVKLSEDIIKSKCQTASSLNKK